LTLVAEYRKKMFLLKRYRNSQRKKTVKGEEMKKN